MCYCKCPASPWDNVSPSPAPIRASGSSKGSSYSGSGGRSHQLTFSSTTGSNVSYNLIMYNIILAFQENTILLHAIKYDFVFYFLLHNLINHMVLSSHTVIQFCSVLTTVSGYFQMFVMERSIQYSYFVWMNMYTSLPALCWSSLFMLIYT